MRSLEAVTKGHLKRSRGLTGVAADAGTASELASMQQAVDETAMSPCQTWCYKSPDSSGYVLCYLPFR